MMYFRNFNPPINIIIMLIVTLVVLLSAPACSTKHETEDLIEFVKVKVSFPEVVLSIKEILESTLTEASTSSLNFESKILSRVAKFYETKFQDYIERQPTLKKLLITNQRGKRLLVTGIVESMPVNLALDRDLAPSSKVAIRADAKVVLDGQFIKVVDADEEVLIEQTKLKHLNIDASDYGTFCFVKYKTCLQVDSLDVPKIIKSEKKHYELTGYFNSDGDDMNRPLALYKDGHTLYVLTAGFTLFVLEKSAFDQLSDNFDLMIRQTTLNSSLQTTTPNAHRHIRVSRQVGADVFDFPVSTEVKESREIEIIPPRPMFSKHRVKRDHNPTKNQVESVMGIIDVTEGASDSEYQIVMDVMNSFKEHNCLTESKHKCDFGKISDEIVNCKFYTCKSHFSNKTQMMTCVKLITLKNNYCYMVFELALLTTTKPGYLQPTVHHFTDNKPRERKSIQSDTQLFEDTLSQQKLSNDKAVHCFFNRMPVFKSGTCNTVTHGDFNSVYTTFKTYYSNSTGATNAFVFTKSTEFWDCDSKDPVWKDAAFYVSITGHYDSLFYDLGRVGLPGYIPGVDCIFTICKVCVKTIPVLLKGKCDIKWTVNNYHHVVEVCNKENYVIGYQASSIHQGARLVSTEVYDSRFPLINFVYFLKYKIKGIPTILEESQPQQIIKGTLKSQKCKNLDIASSDINWLFYYIKCGENIFHHSEEISYVERCKLRSTNSYWPWFYYQHCVNWTILRSFYVIVITLLIVYFVSLFQFSTWIKGIISYVVAPVAYLMFRCCPKFLRCKRCFYPWSPWHTCPEFCICGFDYKNLGRQNEKSHDCILAYKQVHNAIQDSGFKSSDEQDSSNEDGVMLPRDVESQLKKKRYWKLRSKKSDDDLPSEKEYLVDLSTPKSDMKVKLTKSRITAMRRLPQLLRSIKSNFDYQLFSTIKNPYTRYSSSIVYVLIIYICMCLLIPVTLANCEKCTESCYYLDNKPVDNCDNPTQDCMCLLNFECGAGMGKVYAYATFGDRSERRTLLKVPSCVNATLDEAEPYIIDFILHTVLKKESCLKQRFQSTAASTSYLFRTIRGLSTNKKISIFNNNHPKTCGEFLDWLESSSEYKTQVRQKRSSFLLNTKAVLSMEPEVKSLKSDLDLDKASQDSKVSNNLTQAIIHSMKTLQGTVEEQLQEDQTRKKAQLQQELSQVINLLHYNGSIYGRDHAIAYPNPPSFAQSVYTESDVDGASKIDLSITANMGASVSFRPVYQGVEYPLTITLSVPEAAGVYEMLYQYTSCQTKFIDVVRHDKCMGQCSACFDLLKEDLKKDVHNNWNNHEVAEKIEFASPNNWQCEGKGCWTLNTGCLCGYCRNIPDPADCYDIYKLKYKTSRALLCLSINEDRQCEQFNIGDSISRAAKLQIQLQGTNEWATLSNMDSIAIHKETDEILLGPIANLGEITSNFGTPQYRENLTVIFKERDVAADYLCHQQADQDIIVNSCFKDTFSMKSFLTRAPAYIRDGNKKLIYHIGTFIGTYRAIMVLPVDKLDLVYSNLKVKIQSVVCVGCYQCLRGTICTARIDSTATTLVRIKVEGGVIRVSTVNLLKGLRTYNITVDFMDRVPHPILHIYNPNTNQDYAHKLMTVTLKSGNNPRTVVRNTSSVEYNLLGYNDNTYDYISSGINKYNPIHMVSGFLKSSLVHWLLYMGLTVILCVAVIAGIYYFYKYIAATILAKAMAQKKAK